MPSRPKSIAFVEPMGLLLVLGLLVWNFHELTGFTPISPLLASREGVVDGQLFVPNQKSPALIFGLSLFFLVIRFGRLRVALGQTDAFGTSLLLSVSGLGLGIWAHFTNELPLGIVSLSLTLLGVAGLLGGIAALRAMRLPALLLLLAMPIPGVLLNTIVHPLQLSTASSTSVLLDMLGVGNVVYGDTIYTQQAAFQVIEGCSGLRAMETLVMTAIVYQALLPHSRLTSWLLVLSAPLFGALINQVRVVIIVLDPESSTGQDHTTQGLVMIVAGVLLVTAFSMLLERFLPADEKKDVRDDRDPEGRGRRAEGLAIERDQVEHAASMRRIALVVVLLCVSLVARAGEPFEVDRPEHRGPNRLPGRIGPWRAEVEKLDHQFLGSTHYSQSLYRTYRNGDEEVRVLLGLDARQKPLLSGISPRIHMLGQGWRTLERQPVEFEGATISAFESIQQSRDQTAYVVSWQQGTDGPIGEILRNLLALDRSPFQRPYSATAVQISTPITHPTREQRERARARIQPILERVRSTFPPPRAGEPDLEASP